MQPETREGLAGNGFGLRDLVFVMRERQIDSAGVNVESFTEILHGHRGTLNVPARTALAERALPCRFIFFFGLPKHEIARLSFVVFIHIDSGAGADAAEFVVRELAVL